MRKRRSQMAWAAAMWPVAGFAAPGPPPAATISEPAREIVVLGRGLKLPPGTPAYGAVTIERGRLHNDASGRVEDVLADVAGFQQFRRSDSRSANPSAQGVTLRALGGNASSRALVLLDGVPIADPFFGYIPFNALSADRLAAVRITRGGGAGAFGSGAVAGTIELISADRRDLSPFEVSGSVGTDRAVALTGSASPDIGGGFVSLSGRFERGDGFFTTPPSQRVPATARARYRDGSVNMRAVLPVAADDEVQLRGTLYRDHRTLRFRGADSTSRGEDVSVRFLHRGAWQIDAIGYAQSRNFTNKVVSATSFRVTLDQRDTPSTGLGGKIEFRPPVGPGHLLRFGSDIRFARGQLFEDAFGASGTVTARRNAGGREMTAGLFVEEDWTRGPLVLTGGARLDQWSIARGFFGERNAAGLLTSDRRFADRHHSEATFRGGFVLHANRAMALRGAAYTGYRLPTLNELYRPFVLFPVTTLANAALEPERLRGAEAGIDVMPVAGVKLSMTAFRNRLNGAIANATIGPNLRQRRNVAAIDATGIEVTGSARRGPLSIDASYALTRSRVVAPGTPLQGRVPSQSPRQSASATLAYWHGDTPLLSATLRHVGRQFEDDLETDVLRASTTVDAVATVPITSHVWIIARAENLFDATVITRNQTGSIDLGTPRTLWIGVRVRG